MLAKLTWTEIKLGLREPTVAVFALAFPLILLYLLLNSFGTLPDPDFVGVSPADFYVPAYAIGSIAATGLIAVPVHLAAHRERGVLRRLRASGVPAWPVLAAQTLVAAVIVTFGSAVMVALGDASYELSTPASRTVAVTGFALATATFCAVGVALASLLPTARAAQVVGLLAFFAMFFISGGGPPDAILPEGVASRRRPAHGVRGRRAPAGLVDRRMGRHRPGRAGGGAGGGDGRRPVATPGRLSPAPRRCGAPADRRPDRLTPASPPPSRPPGAGGA
jgi:ABC-2 type transport system permease protein